MMPFTYGDGPHKGKVEVEGMIRDNSKPLAIELVAEGRTEWLPRHRVDVTALKGGRVAVRMPKWLARAKKFV